MSKRSDKSIRDLAPLEKGGPVARRGFSFQDHVAVSFCLEMLATDDIVEIGCETEDDITVIRRVGDVETVEFIQVKKVDFDQLWTVAKLCEKEGKSKEKQKRKSILEKSLEHDRCMEPCTFRVVTSRDAGDDLKILKLPLTAVKRKIDSKEMVDLIEAIEKRSDGATSDNHNGVKFWIERTVWDVRHTIESEKNANLLKLEHILLKLGITLAIDQREELY